MRKGSWILLLILIAGCKNPESGTRPEPASPEAEEPDPVRDYSRRNEYVQTHPKIPAEVRQAILQGRVIIGMTPEQAIASLGEPVARKKVTTQGKEEVVLGFGRIHPKTRKPDVHRTVYFENGKAVRIED
ncbi:MAG: hypothetical protein ACYTHM_05950 [Planctomycetota bacterium]